jgi:HlyD family secretion protein
MKIKYLLGLSVALLAACSGNNNRSDAYGTFEADETIVSAEASGKLLEITATEGQKLTAGESIGLVDTVQLSLQLAQLRTQREAVLSKKANVSAQIDVVKEQLKTLGATHARIEKMFADKAATQQQMDDIDGQVRVAKRQIESLNTQFTLIGREADVTSAQIAVTENQLAKCRISSPINGTVLEKYVETGEMMTVGKPVVKLADLSNLNLRVYVSGAQLPSIREGQQVEVLTDQDKTTNQKLSGVITWISPEAEFTPKIIQTKEERVKLVYAVKVKVANDGRLKIGMPGEVNF